MSEPLWAVAMSGGVDSSVVAGLLKREGRNVIGMTMQLWNQRRLPELASDGPTGRCCSIDDVYDARYVAQLLGIPYYVVNFEDDFEKHVVRPFVDNYLKGRTPIPCTLCNNFVKFETFIQMAEGIGAEKVATGHYARITHNQANQRWELRRAVDASKDQTYFLFGLTQEQLSRSLFPLGEMAKADVRALARELNLPVAEKGDSQEICFVPNGDYKAFIEAYCREQNLPLDDRTGDIVTRDGEVLGEHGGYHSYTVGQRRGLGVAAGEPLYVIATEPETRRVVVGRGDDLLTTQFIAGDVNWISIPPITHPHRAHVRIRNKHLPAPATLTPTESPARVAVRFDEPQRAVTPGQGAVFYAEDLVLGGGWIE